MFPNFFSSLLIIVLTATICAASVGGEGSISGKWITKEQGPMTGAQVLLFNAASGPPPSSKKFLRIPDAGTAVDSEGKFSTKVPVGKYYLVMRKRVNPESAGPPENGDPQYYARLKNGQPKTFVVKSGKTTNVGTITTFEPFKREKTIAKEGMTGIEGTVTDDQGLPVVGIRVFAYSSPRVQGRPLYASDETGADGKYFLNVIQGGSYYLNVRTHYGGGKPADGEFMGDEKAPDAVVVEKGKIKTGIDIKVTRLIRKK